ncbi:transcription factor 20 [Pseudorasbora parva]|uniref:transcription factor 20 n=1 Tax=Pseudorasbora parva TaxID=51549 RepID=UPI00351EAD5B
MQNFPNSPVPIHPGFSRGANVVSSPYQAHPSDLQISPRTSEDYVSMQQAQQSLQNHGQNLHLRGQTHLLHAPAVHGYASRRAPTELTQGGGNSYRKDSADYYFSVSGRERSRRGGAAYGAGFRYTNMDVPLQYQHLSGSGSSSGMISAYSMDYGSSGGSAVGTGSSGSFSPSQQYSMPHATTVQSGAQMHQRQHGQKYSSHQGLHQAQHHRTYPLSGSRIPPQFGHFAPVNPTSGSSMYNSPPQRYDVISGGSADAKINNSPTPSNPNAHASNSCENLGQSYSSSSAHPPYSPQSLLKHAPHSQRIPQHTGAGYDPSLKMHTKLPHSSVSSSPALPSQPAQDLTKSPMHSQNQQAQQNFSPISNPSPAPSAVQSPSCSSSSSPLMGNSEGNSVATHLQTSTHLSVSRHGRLLQAVPQLSPTPNSNSSISSCGSGVGTKVAGLNHSAGVSATSQTRMGLGPREDGSLYPHEKLLQDPGLNSLNALTSQVENLPNTVQHMLLTDTVLPQRKSRDGTQHLQSQSLLGNQNKSGSSSASANEESSETLETKGRLERQRIRQASGTSNESEPQMPSEQALDLQVNTRVISTASKQASTRESQTKTPETLTPSSSSPPSVHPSAEHSPKQQVYPPAPPSPVRLARQNSASDNAMKGRRIKMIKDEESEVESADPPCDRESSENRLSVSPTREEAETGALQFENPSKNVNVSEQHNVGVIVSARSELSIDSSKHTGAKSTRYGVSHYPNKHGNPEERRDVLRETRNHNGEGELCMETYVSQYDVSPKQEFGQNIPATQTHPVSFKYNNPEVHYNSTKSKGKLGLGSGMGANRSQNYHQLQASFGSIARKEIFALEGGRGIVSRSQDSSSQFQQSFPSLLQEVLQGHHLDRRYGRPDQTSSVHQQTQDTSQHRYQTRLPYSMVENLSSHAMSSQTVMGGLSVQFNQMASGKPPSSSQNQRPDNEVVLGPHHPSWDSEAHKPGMTHGISLEKGKTSLSPSQSTHTPQSLDLTTGAPPKHINLADYSLQHRKPSRYGTSPSAVEQLLLQEAEPLACGVGPISHTQAQTSTSSGRRSVICDVSPSRRTTPERERGQSGTTGPSVIQQPFSSSGSNDQECCKEEIKAKKAQNKEELSKIETAGQNTDGYSSTPPSKESNNPLHAPVDVDSELEKTSSAKGNNEATSNVPYLSQMSLNPLSSPPRHQSFPHAVDGFRSYGFSDAMDGQKMISHPMPHRPFHTVSAYSKTTPSTNKLQVFPQSLPPQDRPDWTPDRQRLRGMDRHVLQKLSEQKCKSQSASDILPSQHHISRQHSYPSSHFDMKIWDAYPEREGAGQPLTSVPREHVTNAGPKHGAEDILDKSAEETAKSFHTVTPAGAISPAGHASKAIQGIQQGQRLTKTGVSAETNPLIMRRRVRSFISPIPAKRHHQDVPGQRPGSAYHSPLSQSHSDSRHATNNCSSGTDTQPKLPSPKTQHSISSANSPPQSKAKFLLPRKGRGLKLEAIVQKITPSVKKNDFNNSHVESDFLEVPHYTSDLPDPEGGPSFASVPQGDEACLSYLEDSHTLEDLMPYRAVEDAFSCDSQSLKPGATASSCSTLRSLPKDFDFGLGAAGSSGSLVGENDKDDFTLLGPLPPAPPLPCPVQGSPPPSSSALSDIQQFTNTYQELETRRSEQSAANLLRQKLQETGMGFEDYPGGDYYGSPTCHNQSPGHHLLSRASQHHMTSLESKHSESNVPKGYFPSGKKKGRPVGSVNKQKRAQAQTPNATTSIPSAPIPSPTAVSQSLPVAETADEVPRVSTPPDQNPSPPLVPPAQTQVVKVDVESEENQPELDLKPAKHKQKKGKEVSETPGSSAIQSRRRRGMASKEELDPQTSSRGSMSLCGIFPDARNNVFAPYVHVEKKVAEIGAVCTIINAEDEKSKGAGKTGHSGVDGPVNSPMSTQLVRKEKENENWVSEQVDSALQSGKTLPTSGYVLQGPVVSETGQTGRLVCCLCQKWANYKHLGDLYGPFYPAEYAAKLPKNQPQVRQTMSHHGAATTGMTSVPTDSAPQDTTPQNSQNVKSSTESDCAASQAIHPTSPATTIAMVSPSMGEEMAFHMAKTLMGTAPTWDPAAEVASGLGTSNLLESEIRPKQMHVESSQPRPQHRKLTSHPRFKRRHKSSEDLPRTVPINSKASLPFQPPPPSLDSLDPMAQISQLPLVVLDPEELWVHEGCIAWTSGVYLVNGRLYGLQEALDGARDTSCSHCEMVGSTLGCYSKGCTLSYHYLCAMEADCSLNEDNFSLRCPKHKSNRISKPGAVHLEQSERG